MTAIKVHRIRRYLLTRKKKGRKKQPPKEIKPIKKETPKGKGITNDTDAIQNDGKNVLQESPREEADNSQKPSITITSKKDGIIE